VLIVPYALLLVPGLSGSGKLRTVLLLISHYYLERVRPKLIYLCKFNPYRTVGGAAIRNRGVLSLLSKKFDVYLVCFSSNDEMVDGDVKVFSLKQESNPVISIVCDKSLSVAHFYSKRMVAVIRGLFNEHVFSATYVSELAMFQYVRHIKSSQQPKIILDCHNIEGLLVRDAVPYQARWRQPLFLLESHALMRFEREAINRSDSVVFVSEADRQLADVHYNCDHKAFVIPNCLDQIVRVDHTEKRDCSKLDRFAIVGTLDWHANRSGIEWFIDKIWKPYSFHNPSSELYLIGKKYKRGGEFTGAGVLNFYNVDDIGTILRLADVGVAPLLYGGGSRLKILEYFAYCKPVIATSKAAHGLEIKPGIHYLKVDNYAEFQQATEALLDTKLRSSLVQNGLALVQSKHMIDQYATTLLSALSTSPLDSTKGSSHEEDSIHFSHAPKPHK